MRGLIDLRKKLEEKGVATVAVSLDSDRQALKEFAVQLTGWPVLCDYRGFDGSPAKTAYGVTGVPNDRVIDPFGRIRFCDGTDTMRDEIIEDIRLEVVRDPKGRHWKEWDKDQKRKQHEKEKDARKKK